MGIELLTGQCLDPAGVDELRVERTAWSVELRHWRGLMVSQRAPAFGFTACAPAFKPVSLPKDIARVAHDVPKVKHHDESHRQPYQSEETADRILSSRNNEHIGNHGDHNAPESLDAKEKKTAKRKKALSILPCGSVESSAKIVLSMPLA